MRFRRSLWRRSTQAWFKRLVDASEPEARPATGAGSRSSRPPPPAGVGTVRMPPSVAGLTSGFGLRRLRVENLRCPHDDVFAPTRIRRAAKAPSRTTRRARLQVPGTSRLDSTTHSRRIALDPRARENPPDGGDTSRRWTGRAFRKYVVVLEQIRFRRQKATSDADRPLLVPRTEAGPAPSFPRRQLKPARRAAGTPVARHRHGEISSQGMLVGSCSSGCASFFCLSAGVSSHLQRP